MMVRELRMSRATFPHTIWNQGILLAIGIVGCWNWFIDCNEIDLHKTVQTWASLKSSTSPLTPYKWIWMKCLTSPLKGAIPALHWDAKPPWQGRQSPWSPSIGVGIALQREGPSLEGGFCPHPPRKRSPEKQLLTLPWPSRPFLLS